MARPKIKITVLAKLRLGEDIFNKYSMPSVDLDCKRVNVGEEFIVENINMPKSFCSWAWADIQRDVVHLALGGDFDWIKDKGVAISACTDGLRPVIFKLERIEE